MAHVQETVDIQAPIRDCFSRWMRFEEFPAFMNHVNSVTKVDNNVWHWIVDGPIGADLEWDAEMEGIEADYVIAWRTVSDSAVKASGKVMFTEANPSMTRVTSELDYEAPMGKMGEMVAKMFSDPAVMVKEDLWNFKNLVEEKSSAPVM